MISQIIGAICISILFIRLRQLQKRSMKVNESLTFTNAYVDSVQMSARKHYERDVSRTRDDPLLSWYRTYADQTNNFATSGDVYDNSLLLGYFTATLQYSLAWRLAHTFLYLLNYEKYVVDASDYADRVRYFRGLKPRYNVDLKTGYMSPGSEAWVELDVGNNSYVCISLFKFGHANDAVIRQVYDKNPFTQAAVDITRFIHEKARCVQNTEIVGYVARPFSRGEWQTYMSNEHMIDMYALSNMMMRHAPNMEPTIVRDVRAVSASFVHKLYGSKTGNYDTGAGVCFPPKRDLVDLDDGSAPAPGPYRDVSVRHRDENTPEEWASFNYIAIAADVQTWNMLSDADDNRARKLSSLDWVVKHCLVRDTLMGKRGCYEASAERRAAGHKADVANVSCDDVDKKDLLWGFRFTEWGSGIQWENAGSGVMALMKAAMKFKVSRYDDVIEKVIGSIRRMMEHRKQIGMNGLVANLRGLDQYGFEGGPKQNTGLTWGYFRSTHLGGSIYCMLSLMYYEHYRRRNLRAAEVYNPYSTLIASGATTVDQLKKFPDDALSHDFLVSDEVQCPFESPSDVRAKLGMKACSDDDKFETHYESHFWVCDPNRRSWYTTPGNGPDEYWKLFGETWKDAFNARCNAPVLRRCNDSTKRAMISAFESRYATNGGCPVHTNG